MDASVKERRAVPGGRTISLRFASGAVLSVLTLVAVWRGGWWFAGYTTLFLLLALAEFYRMAGRAGIRCHVLPGLLAGLALLVFGMTHETRNLGAVLAVVTLWMGFRALAPPVEGRLAGLALTVFGVVYVCGLGLHFLWIREGDAGLPRLLVSLLGTWSADTFAFFVGMRWGKRPLAPHVSPAKTVEGFLGGLGGSILVVALLAPRLLPELSVFHGLLLGLVLGLVSPLGDLLESVIKRNLHAKDASRAIPGHGGVLDRIDSLLVSIPMAYYVFRFLTP